MELDKIVEAVRASRAEFADAFLQAQRDLPPDERSEFEAVAAEAAGADDRTAFTAGFRFAERRGWLKALLFELVANRLDNGALADGYLDADERADLHAFVNPDAGMLDPHLYADALRNGLQWTGKVLVDGEATGTCVLIGPHLALTAWHVVRGAFEENGESYSPRANGASLVQCLFDDYLRRRNGAVVANPPVNVECHATLPWCPGFGPCHPRELLNELPESLDELDGFCDFAVLRLAKPIGLERGYATSHPRATTPGRGQRIFVFQHPTAGSLRLDAGTVWLPNDDRFRGVVPRVRFLHRANAAPGSSGGPCFNGDFMLCGLHQGEWPPIEGEGRLNRAVPLAQIHLHLRNFPDDFLQLDEEECPVSQLPSAGRTEPVVGCDGFVRDLWSVALTGRHSLLRIDGMEKSGKSFRIRVAQAALPDKTHLKIVLHAPTLAPLGAEQVAVRICAAAGVELGPIPPSSEAESTTAAWLKGTLVPQVLRALESVRRGRLAWLMLSDLNGCDVFGPSTSEFLYLLYERTLEHDWFKVVLDGMRGDLPPEVRQRALRHDVPSIQPHEIVDCLQRQLAQKDVAPPDPAFLRGVAALIHQTYIDLDRSMALANLARQVETFRASLSTGADRGRQ